MSKKILIVEDDVDIARLVQLQLRDIGYESDIIDNGAKALERLGEPHDYDRLILDIMLPDCDGLSICQKVREIMARIKLIHWKIEEIDDKANILHAADYEVDSALAGGSQLFRQLG